MQKILNPINPPLSFSKGGVLGNLGTCKKDPLSAYVKHSLDFSFVVSAPLPACWNLFSARGIFCGGRYQPGYTGIFRPAEGTSQPVTISKKWKNRCSAVLWKRTWVNRSFCDFRPVPSTYRPRAQISDYGRLYDPLIRAPLNGLTLHMGRLNHSNAAFFFFFWQIVFSNWRNFSVFIVFLVSKFRK